MLSLRQALGGAVSRVGTALRLPEWGISERIAGTPRVDALGLSPHTQRMLSEGRIGGHGQGGTIGPVSSGGSQPSGGAGGGFAGGGFAGGQPDPMSLLRESMAARRDSIQRGGAQSFRDIGDSFQTGARGLVEQLRRGQRDIDSSRQSIAVDRMRSIDDLVKNIRQGIQSGAIQLAGAGILPGSAPQALARDFGQFGTQQRGQIMGQAGEGMRELDFEQEDLNRARDLQATQLRMTKDTETNRVSNDVMDKLTALEFEARDGGLTDFQVRHLRDQIVNQGVQRLIQLDQWLKTQMGGIRPQDRQAIEAEAHRIARENQAPGGFDFTAPGVGFGGAAGLGGTGLGAGLGARPEDEF